MRLTKWAARLYPRWWRERYGEEFAALLEDARPGLSGALNVTRGAIAMQMRTWSAKRVLALGTTVGLLGGLGMALFKPTYESTVVLTSAAPLDKNAADATAVADYFARQRLLKIVRTSSLYREERFRMTSDGVVVKIRGALDIVPRTLQPDGLHDLEIHYRYHDKALADKTVDALGTSFIERAQANGFAIRIKDSGFQTRRIFPELGTFAGTGFLSGLISAGIFALGMAMGRRKLSIGQE